MTSQPRSDTLTTRHPLPPPYASKIKQMTFLARYVMIENQGVRVEESFIDFIETKNKTAEGISDMINLAQKYVFLRPEVILSMDELNLDQALQDINKEEFQVERVRLQAFVAAIEPGCKKLIRSSSLWAY
ncbi:hypothetical protein TNCV_2089071 [Trichonephila clavipes]|nr:hypothetical protein TNCV_2089071 [Trichonephila clavipes]